MSPTPSITAHLVEEVERLGNIAGAHAESLRRIQGLTAQAGEALAVGRPHIAEVYVRAILDECLRANIVTVELEPEVRQ